MGTLTASFLYKMDLTPPPTVSQNLSVSFVISRWDLLQCRLWAITQNRFVLGMILFISAAIPLLKMPAAKNLNHPHLFKMIFFIVSFSIVLFFMIVVQIITQIAFLFSGQNRGVLGQQQITLRPDAIVVRSEAGDSTFDWRGFDKICAKGGFVFLYVGGNIVHYVPLRCFSSDVTADQFKNEILRRVNQIAAS